MRPTDEYLSYTVSYKREPGYLIGGFRVGSTSRHEGTYAQVIDRLWERAENEGKVVELIEIRRDGKIVHKRSTLEYRDRKRDTRERTLAKAWTLVEEHGCTCRQEMSNEG